MKPSLDLRDLPLIRGSILLSLLLSMLGLGLVKVSHDGSTEMREILERLRSQRREIKEMQARLRSDEQEIRRTRLRYEEITKRGYLNREHRLEWVERIRKIGPDAIEDIVDVYDPLSLAKPWHVRHVSA